MSTEERKDGNIHPAEELRKRAKMWGYEITDETFAKRMDQEDPIRELRELFYFPKKGNLPKSKAEFIDPEEDSVYMTGNSLGLQPKCTRKNIDQVLDKWAKWGVHANFLGDEPWQLYDDVLDPQMAGFVGAKTEEVTVMNALTVNAHLLLISFYRPNTQRHKILIEHRSFPSDQFMVESQIRLHGYDPKTSLICLSPREGEHCLRQEDIEDVINKEGDSIAVIWFAGVQYYTGQLFDMDSITRAGHAKGIYVGFDLAHAVGNVELCLHDWDVDFACWCTYKFLNSGYGGIGGIFVNERFYTNDFPKLDGWWSHKMSTRFQMSSVLDQVSGAAAYRISQPSTFMCCTLEASFQVFAKTNMKELRVKSKLLTGYLELLINHVFPKPMADSKYDRPYGRIITPSDPNHRGAQLSVMFTEIPVSKIYDEMCKRGAVIDKREPNVLRITPVPMYNSFHDVYRVIELMKESVEAAK